jgi:hypothetical protein
MAGAYCSADCPANQLVTLGGRDAGPRAEGHEVVGTDGSAR